MRNAPRTGGCMSVCGTIRPTSSGPKCGRIARPRGGIGRSGSRRPTETGSDALAKVPVLQQRFENRTRLETLGLLPRLSDERLQAEQAYLDNRNTLAALRADLKQLDS